VQEKDKRRRGDQKSKKSVGGHEMESNNKEVGWERGNLEGKEMVGNRKIWRKKGG
jgi:hypothetical protein